MPTYFGFSHKPARGMTEDALAAQASRPDRQPKQWPDQPTGLERGAQPSNRFDARDQPAAVAPQSSALPEGITQVADGEKGRQIVDNGALLERRAEEAFEHANIARRRVAIVCLDLDNLEEVFQQLGAEGADLCVESIGVALTRRLRGMDTIARTDTKTFTIVLAELDDEFALHRVAAALLKIFAVPIHVQGHSFVISASVGVAVYPDDGFDLTRLSRAAETAMHQARMSGGHRVAMFSLDVRERTELDTYMRETMKRGGFRLYYQPQYSPSGEIRTLEALLRLPGKDADFISPDLFIPVAEDSGMIEQLGMWVIEQAARQVKAWHREYGRLAHVAVNVSPLQLRGPEFAERALSTIRSHGVVPASIEFEITERAVLNFDEVCEPMRKLSDAGIVFAVDDFGTGYSSLQHLHRLPISVLKIDRSFVQRVGVPEGAEAIIEAIVSMAHSLGMRVVAEGVETQAQRFAATEMGCDSIQGFLHTPAVDASKIPGLMGWTN
jgi:diguanylate cyclase (GGDEF)-like protein